jgi:hypothetical protein
MCNLISGLTQFTRKEGLFGVNDAISGVAQAVSLRPTGLAACATERS